MERKTKLIIWGGLCLLIPLSLNYLQPPEQTWGWPSLLPGATSIIGCYLFQNSLLALGGGVLVGLILLLPLQPQLPLSWLTLPNALQATSYFLLTAILLGIWRKSQSWQRPIEHLSHKLIQGPRSAKLTAWLLGILCFQGGAFSTIVVGTVVRPLATKHRVSPEELAYIVDSTAAPVACLIPLNAWPFYIQSLIYVSGAKFLATVEQRLTFFLLCIPLSFYAILAILGTLLLALDHAPILGKSFRQAIDNARKSKQPQPLPGDDHSHSTIPPSKGDFVYSFTTLLLLVFLLYLLTNQIYLLAPLLIAASVALFTTHQKGTPLSEIKQSILKSSKFLTMILLLLTLAITLGTLSQKLGVGPYLTQLLTKNFPHYLLPLLLFTTTILIALATGTSWGTYAITFPIAMPLAWQIAQASHLQNPQLFLMVCFASVLNGSVFGDQCSPISDTSVTAAICTGCSLPSHIRTQIVPASLAALLASIGWLLFTLLAVH